MVKKSKEEISNANTLLLIKMSDWKELNIDINGLGLKTIHSKVCENITSKEKSDFWIAEVDLCVAYKVFSSLREMCEDIWADWPGDDVDDFIEEYRVSDEAPIVEAEHMREYYVLKNRELAEEFLKKSVVVIRNNPHEDDE